MKPRLWLSIFLALGFLASALTPAAADGIIIPTVIPCVPPDCGQLPMRPITQLNIRYHHVDVHIQDQIAVTRVDQVFYNPNDWPVEGTYIFPLPVGAAVSRFILWVDGQPVEGKVLDAAQARQTYEEIVRSMRDPALLEYIGRGAVQASIFPIQPKSERRIELEYTQALISDQGLVRYTYPLNTEKFSLQPLESVSVRVQVESQATVRAVYSPSHLIAVKRDGDRRFSASYEASQVTPDQDFTLMYSIAQGQPLNLFTWKDPSETADPGGFFLLLLTPPDLPAAAESSKDILLVLDQSGSMEGEKMEQARSALRYILQHLNPNDRFYLSAFSSDVQEFRPDLVSASESLSALEWVNSLYAAGSTDINRALLQAASVSGNERPTYLVFLTDGLPSEGVLEAQQILANFAASAPSRLHLFAFGVGYDVDTFLLDSLSENHGGQSTYIQPGEALDEKLSEFYGRIRTPLLSNVEIDFGSIPVYDVYPSPLPDLFEGSQVVVAGRYRTGGSTNLTLRGAFNNERLTFEFPRQVFTETRPETNPVLESIPRLWATRKIGHLLNTLRLKGLDAETVQQIVKLSIRYGIVTPYTSYLVTEPMPLGAANQEEVARDAYEGMMALPTEAVMGAPAVQKAAGIGDMSRAEAPEAPAAGEAAERVRILGSRTFLLSDQGIWVDTAFDPENMKPQPVAFLSPDYFALAQSSPELAAALALGERVILLNAGQVYEVVTSNTPVKPLKITPSPMPTIKTGATQPSRPDLTPTPRPDQVNPTRTPQQPTPQPDGSAERQVLLLGGAVVVLSALLLWVLSRKGKQGV